MIIATFNPKGGAGKTTTAVNVATMLARRDRSVLLVDLEADLNASISLGVRPVHSDPSIADVLLRRTHPAAAVRAAGGVKNLWLITGSPALAQMDAALRHVKQPERRLADVIRPLEREFDVIVLDSPSGYSLIAQSVPTTAHQILVPMRAEYLSLESLAQFLPWYRDRQESSMGLAQIVGILLTMVDYRQQATREIVGILRKQNRSAVFRAEVPHDPRATEAPSHGVPLVAYAPKSRACAAYETVTTELLQRARRRS
jgi:chromosome partitioning protein